MPTDIVLGVFGHSSLASVVSDAILQPGLLKTPRTEVNLEGGRLLNNLKVLINRQLPGTSQTGFNASGTNNNDIASSSVYITPGRVSFADIGVQTVGGTVFSLTSVINGLQNDAINSGSLSNGYLAGREVLIVVDSSASSTNYISTVVSPIVYQPNTTVTTILNSIRGTANADGKLVLARLNLLYANIGTTFTNRNRYNQVTPYNLTQEYDARVDAIVARSTEELADIADSRIASVTDPLTTRVTTAETDIDNLEASVVTSTSTLNANRLLASSSSGGRRVVATSTVASQIVTSNSTLVSNRVLTANNGTRALTTSSIDTRNLVTATNNLTSNRLLTGNGAKGVSASTTDTRNIVQSNINASGIFHDTHNTIFATLTTTGSTNVGNAIYTSSSYSATNTTAFPRPTTTTPVWVLGSIQFSGVGVGFASTGWLRFTTASSTEYALLVHVDNTNSVISIQLQNTTNNTHRIRLVNNAFNGLGQRTVNLEFRW